MEDFKKEIKILGNVIDKIKAIYEKLISLEIEGKIDSEEYDDLIDYLKKLRIVEEETYETFRDKPYATTDFLNKLLNYDINCFADDLNVLRDNDDKKLILLRPVRYLQEVIDNFIFDDNYDREFMEDASSYDEEEYEEDELYYEEENELDIELLNSEDPENLEKQMDYLNRLDENIEQDIVRTILRILNDYIENPMYCDIKASLIRFKYMISYLYKYIEDDFIDNKFMINPDLYLSSKLISDILPKGEKDLKSLQDSYATDILPDQANCLLDLMENNITETGDYSKAIIAQIIMRSVLLFASPESLSSFRDIMFSDLQEMGIKNMEVEDIIMKSIMSVDEDKELPMILSFKI